MASSTIPTAVLVESPMHPNSLAWSEDNLLAVAASHLVIILNPASPHGPRGVITLPQHKPFPVGVVQKEDLLNACRLPTSFSRAAPCARSISWSPLGFAPSSGCLLAICTVEGRVKIYNDGFPELRSEWAEVVDISDMLYDYLARTNFTGSISPTVMLEQDTAVTGFAGKSDQCKAFKGLTPLGVQLKSRNIEVLPLITAREFASRSALVSSLVVAWSPVLRASSGCKPAFHSKYAILALGGKSGHISFWRFHEQQSSNFEQPNTSVEPIFAGYLHAHSTWVTAISWEMRGVASQSRLFLATGSSDGSMKIWVGDVEQLINYSEISGDCFSLLKELTSFTYIPISTISMVAPNNFSDNLVLAVGRGSGSLEIWTCHISGCSSESAEICDAHDQVITGLAWAFDGGCLYSCSHDNSLRSWNLNGSSPCEPRSPSNSPFSISLSNVMQLNHPCIGLAFSPGNLVLSVVYKLDSESLNQMYEARTQKAAVKFFWVGGKPLEVSASKILSSSIGDISALSERELHYWEADLIWCLKQYENVDKPLVIWDVLMALLTFKQSATKFAEGILSQWFSSWFAGSSDASFEKTSFCIITSISKISTRKLQLLNIVCRRLLIADAPSYRQNGLQSELDELYVTETEKINLWREILVKIEMELLVRLVAFNLKAFLNLGSHSAQDHPDETCWLPSGVAQMEHWVAANSALVPDELKLLASDIRGHRPRFHSINKCLTEERCDYCSASVPFESPEYAVCNGKHKLIRCSTSMRLCSVVSHLWYCKCCQRWAERVVPETFFTMAMSPLDSSFVISSLDLMEPSKPSCPFCGISLQRSKPDFLLSISHI